MSAILTRNAYGMRIDWGKPVKTELETYPFITAAFRKLHNVMCIRQGAGGGLPDFYIQIGIVPMWLEVKRSRKDKAPTEYTMADVKWEPGQLVFRKRMRDMEAMETYWVAVVPPSMDKAYLIQRGLIEVKLTSISEGVDEPD